jgi:hypothetical protein
MNNQQIEANKEQRPTDVASSAVLGRMSFKDALKKLGIEDYGERIFNSNSHGELMHLMDYIWMAQNADAEAVKWFRPMFVVCVKWAEENWQRPESCFQHMPRLMNEMADALRPNESSSPASGEQPRT